jgi:hypothetical protein
VNHYKRHGTTMLFAVIDGTIIGGKVIVIRSSSASSTPFTFTPNVPAD